MIYDGGVWFRSDIIKRKKMVIQLKKRQLEPPKALLHHARNYSYFVPYLQLALHHAGALRWYPSITVIIYPAMMISCYYYRHNTTAKEVRICYYLARNERSGEARIENYRPGRML